MMETRKVLTVSLTFIVLCLGAAERVRADAVVLTLTNPAQAGTHGSTLTYSGFYTNTGPSPFTVFGGTLFIDFNGFFFVHPGSAFASLTVPAMSTSPTVTLFELIITLDALPGTYAGSFRGAGFTSNTTPTVFTNFEPFTFTILPRETPVPVPEPATLLLLGTGLAGAVGAVLGGRRAARLKPPNRS